MFALMRSAIGTDINFYNFAIHAKAGKTCEPKSLAALIKTQTKIIQKRLQGNFNSGKRQDRIQAGQSLLERHRRKDRKDWLIFISQSKIKLTNEARSKP